MLIRKRESARAFGRGLTAALLGGVAAAAIAGDALAAAEPDEAKTSQLEELVVTARRTEESAQKVPLAVTAISETALREKSITAPTELMFNAPSVSMVTLFGRLSGGFNIRGLAGGTQVYYAEVAGGPTEASAPFFDVSSVQVLNGPQGTLFGRANTAGAVLVEPHRPELGRWGGELDVQAGDLGLNRLTGVVNIPLIGDELAARIAVHREHLDGYTSEIGTGRKLNENNSENVRASLEWRPGGGKFSNYTVVDVFHVDESSGGWTLLAVNPSLGMFNLPANINAPGGLATGTATFGAACTRAVGAGLAGDLNSCIDQRLRMAATFKPTLLTELARIQTGGDKAVRSTPGLGDLPEKELLHKYTVVNQTQYDFGDLGFTTLSVKNIFGFQAVTGVTGWALDGVGGLIQESVSVSGASAYGTTPSGQQVGRTPIANEGPYQKTYSDELQVRGVVGQGLIAWNLGGYYQYTPQIKNMDGIRNLSRVFNGITLPNLGFNPSFPFANGGHTQQQALFGQATVDLSRLVPQIAGLHVTGGLRKSWDEARLTTTPVTTDLATGRYVTNGASVTSVTKSNGYNYTVSLDAQLTDEILLYVAHRKGYRPGGINQVLNASAFPNFTPTYAPEEVKDVEVGVKSEFPLGAGRARVNVAGYWTDYSNIQRTFSGSANGVTATYIVNASAARIDGAELTAEYVVGAWNLGLTYAYSDPRFTNWVGSDPLGLIKPGNAACLPGSTAAICLIDLAASPFPNISKNAVTLNAKYRLPVDRAWGDVSVLATAAYQGRRYFTDAAARNIQAFGPSVLNAVSQPAFTRYNLRADWRNIRGSSFSAAAFVNNLTDKKYLLTTITQLHSLGESVGLFAEPRTWGVEVRYAFGG
jgi:iron complex outermembrane receptor protein